MIISGINMEASDICLLFLLFSYIHAVQPYSMHIDSRSTVVSRGTTAELECYGGGRFPTGARVEWRRESSSMTGTQTIGRWSQGSGSELLDGADATRYALGSAGEASRNGLFVQTLTIREIQKTDRGRYRCVLIETTGTETSSSSFELTVKYPPAEHFPHCTALPDETGDEVSLICMSERTTPPLTLRWYRNDSLVAEDTPVGAKMKAVYRAQRQDFTSSFECRLTYNDDVEPEVRRSCYFSRPYIAILRLAEANSRESKYHAFVHSNPPFISDISCDLTASHATSRLFETEFPGYGFMTIGPLAPADNGSVLICRAENALGVAEARMTVYSHRDGSLDETTLPSVVTNMYHENAISALIVPKNPTVYIGEGVSFGCSYRSALHTLFTTHTVHIRWTFNGKDVHGSKFDVQDDVLTVRNISQEDDGASVMCIASFGEDIDISGRSEPTILRVRVHSGSVSYPHLAESIGGQPTDKVTGTTQIALIVSVSVAVAVLLILLLLLLLQRRGEKHHEPQFIYQAPLSPQISFRADSNTLMNGQLLLRGQNRATIQSQRELPAEPTEATGAIAATLTPAPIPTGTLDKPNTSSASIVEDSQYQPMVGDTGVMRSRQGSCASSAHSEQHPLLCRSLTLPASGMIPVPTGGFLPSNMVTSTGHRRAQRSMIESQHCEIDENYEDPDVMRERRKLQRAMSNDYQQPASNKLENSNAVLSQYANTSVEQE
ncbi:uncharacterized protein [Diadema antillarum]|uniref:uncharacterized protein n=1 Tax=Diadema antillarum TaxID=105358 RepID=UPI003A86C259